jgi:hypothetical protein
MDNHQKMRQLMESAAEMAEKAYAVGTVAYLFDLTAEMDPFRRGVLFGHLKTHMEQAEFHLRRVASHLGYELKERAKETEGDGA